VDYNPQKNQFDYSARFRIIIRYKADKSALNTIGGVDAGESEYLVGPVDKVESYAKCRTWGMGCAICTGCLSAILYCIFKPARQRILPTDILEIIPEEPMSEGQLNVVKQRICGQSPL
jgi:hypothetical protein